MIIILSRLYAVLHKSDLNYINIFAAKVFV